MKNKKLIVISIITIAALFFVSFLSIAYGVKTVSLESVRRAFFEKNAVDLEVNIVRARIPRTVFGLLAGAGLGVSGLLMQSITRNPVADPSILGVNTGASLLVVCGIAFFNITSGNVYILLAFLGAFATAILVYGLASLGKGGATPMRLVLAGAACTTALQSVINTILLPNARVMDQFRFWQTGSIGGASWEDIRIIFPYLSLGFVIAIALIPSLNALALGDEVATSLGISVGGVRIFAAFSGVLLCASVTALAGPIGFIGLMIPHFVRSLLGPDLKKVMPFCAAGGAFLLVAADMAGRVLGRPGELESGIITALIGGPIFIGIIRKGKVRSV